MNIVIGFAVVIVITAVSITAMLLVRRRAPAGSYFSDGDRASGVFGVLATGFSVLLGFIIVIAFQSYDESRAGAEAEAAIVAQQVETAQFLPADTAKDLTGQLVCYARSVIGPQWAELERGRLSESINPWGGQMYLTIKAADPQTTAEQSAYDRWMDQTSDRETARLDRIHAAQGIIPLPLWIALFVIFVVILKNKYEDVYGTGLNMRFGGGYMLNDETEARVMFTFQSLDADLATLGDYGASPLYGQYSDYQSLTLDVGLRRYGRLRSNNLRPYAEGSIGLGFVDKTDVELVAPQANLRRDATDFYDQTTAFTFSGNAGVLWNVSPRLGVFAQLGLRWVTGMSEVDNFVGTGLESINDNSSRWTMPFLVGARLGF